MPKIAEKTHKAERTVRKLKQVNLFGVLAFLNLLVVFLLLGYYGYMKLQVWSLETTLQQEEQKLLDTKRDLARVRNQPLHQKYQAAKYLEEERSTIARKDTFSYLISLFNKVDAVDDNISNVTLSNFRISMNHTIRFRWSVTHIRDMYLPGGLLDKIIALDFIEYINIPYYRTDGELVQFSLDAILIPDDRN